MVSLQKLVITSNYLKLTPTEPMQIFVKSKNQVKIIELNLELTLKLLPMQLQVDLKHQEH